MNAIFRYYNILYFRIFTFMHAKYIVDSFQKHTTLSEFYIFRASWHSYNRYSTLQYLFLKYFILLLCVRQSTRDPFTQVVQVINRPFDLISKL